MENDLSAHPSKEGFSFMANFASPPPQVQAQAQPPQPSPSPTSRSCASPTLWYYRDPNGDVRGPFDDATMAAWFSAGYFPVTIEVRRKCDKVFLRISESRHPSPSPSKCTFLTYRSATLCLRLSHAVSREIFLFL